MLQHSYDVIPGTKYTVTITVQIRAGIYPGVFSIEWHQGGGNFKTVFVATSLQAGSNIVAGNTYTSAEFIPTSTPIDLAFINNGTAVSGLADGGWIESWQVRIYSINIYSSSPVRCIQCSPTTVANGTACVCLDGTYANGTTCSQCSAGSYCVNGVSRSCPVQTYSNGSGLSTCVPCPVGYNTTSTGALSCLVCESNAYANIGTPYTAPAQLEYGTSWTSFPNYNLGWAYFFARPGPTTLTRLSTTEYYGTGAIQVGIMGSVPAVSLEFSLTTKIALLQHSYPAILGMQYSITISAARRLDVCGGCCPANMQANQGVFRIAWREKGDSVYQTVYSTTAMIPGISCTNYMTSAAFTPTTTPIDIAFINDGTGASGLDNTATHEEWIVRISSIVVTAIPFNGCVKCPSNTLSNGAACVCLNGTYANGANCSQCLAGSFCVNGASYQCQPGKFSNTTGATACLNCMVGSFSNYSGSPVCFSCLAGTYSNVTGVSACVGCSTGLYSSLGASVCSTCTSNKAVYSNQCRCAPGYVGDANCFLCQSNTFCPGGFANYSIPCLNGTYSVPGSWSSSQCVCPNSSYYNGTNCTCSAGYYKVLNSSLPLAGWQCVVCAKGSVCANDTASTCANGTYASAIGMSACSACNSGSFSLTNASTCALCAMGKFASASGSDQCSVCGIGVYANATGKSECTACDAGKFNAVPGSTTCAECAIGTFANSTASSSCSGCAANTYASAPGSAECVLCPDFSFSPPFSNTSGACTCAANRFMSP